MTGTLPLRSDRLAALVAAPGVLAVLLLLVGLLARWPGVLPWSSVLVGAEYATFLLLRGKSIDAFAPLYAVGLLLCAELFYWSIERHVPADRPGLAARRVTLVLAACLAAGGIGGLILSAAQLAVRGGLGLEALGIAAALGAFAMLARLARSE